jgi:superfamily II DNA or RNA helicase
VLGGIAYYDAKRGIVITNSFFTPPAIELAKKAGIELVTRQDIKTWMQAAKVVSPKIISPLPHQQDVLINLSDLRKKGESRALIVLASGLGKTYVSALDAFSFQEGFGKPLRVLYLSHQSVILEQASRSFRNVFGNNRSIGRFDGEERYKDADLLFASFQSIHKSLNIFDPFEFEYVVVDEAHHTAARTRDAVVRYFKPRFMLGLTATPLRGDGKDIYEYYNDIVAASLPIERAIAQGLLTSIDYRVLSDKADPHALMNVLKLSGKLSKEITFKPRSDKDIVDIILGEARSMVNTPKIIVFCSSLEQMDHFAQLFPNCKTISGRDDRKRQVAAVEAFASGDFPVLLARDVLNEGIDIPDANILIFLRNTESPVVFLQQLGRGLRKAEGKEKVIVLDFVNNVERFDFVYSFFSRLQAEILTQKSRNPKDAIVPSTLTLDQTAKDIVSAIIRKKVESGFIVETSSLLSLFKYEITVGAIRKLVQLGKIVPDFTFTDDSGTTREYIEKHTIQRFVRQVHSIKYLEGLIPEQEFARHIGKTVQWLKRQVKFGEIYPSWIHQFITGQIMLYFTKQDIEETLNQLRK